VRTKDDVCRWRGLEESERAAGTGGQHAREGSGVFDHLGIPLLVETVERTPALGLRETGAFWIDEDAVAWAEIPRELLHPADLTHRVVREAIDEHVRNPMAYDVQAGIPEQLPLEDVPEPDSVRLAHQRRGQQRIAAAGVPNQKQVGAAREIRIALDLDAQPEEPHHRPEER
jgi:hypothetical protein